MTGYGLPWEAIFNLEQTNPGQNTTNMAGDVSVDYRLSKDGRYMIRVYRKDQYETVVQAQVVETGLSFILTFDYNKFRELFQNKKEARPPHPNRNIKKQLLQIIHRQNERINYQIVMFYLAAGFVLLLQ